MAYKNLSDIQQQKFRWWFQALDADHDGVLNQEDCFDYLYKWDALFGLDQKPAFREILFRMQHKFWHELSDHARSKTISPSQWLSFMDDLVKRYRKDYLVDDQIPAGKWGQLLFELMDTDNNNKASHDSYSRYILSLSFDNAAIEQAWHELDPDNHGYITLDEFLKRLTEFFFSSDLHDPGNFLLAPPADWYRD